MVFRYGSWPLALISFFSISAQADFISYLPNGDESRLIDFGSGEDGAFSDGPTQSGVTIAGANITFDTDVKSEFHFTNFTISGAFTATITGSRPLIIKATEDVSIAGILRANGGAGAVNAGGTNRGSGAAGGAGGLQAGGAAGIAGSSSHSASSGGGAKSNPVAQGDEPSGGGGCFGQSGAGVNDVATAGASGSPGGSAGTCTTSRSNIARSFENEFLGGGSGGGGASWGNAASDSNGGGGGAGGGAIRVSAKGNLSVTGTLQANGGNGSNGGAFVAQDCGGAGGGGSGGAIWIQSGRTFSGNGTIGVSPGTGGVNPDCGYTGGNGSRGVIRVDSSTDSFTGTYSPVNSTDLSFSMTEAPVITEFTLKGGGMACGTLTSRGPRGDGNPDSTSALLEMISLFCFFYFFSRFTGRRSTNSENSKSCARLTYSKMLRNNSY